jgi:hypothetical protein
VKRCIVVCLSVVLLAASLCAVSGVASAAPGGATVGNVTAVTGAYIDLSVNRQIVQFMLPAPFYAVYMADRRTIIPLAAVKPGYLVRVTFTQGAGALKKAIEIDVLTNPL